MKKALFIKVALIALCAILAFGLVACDKNKDKGDARLDYVNALKSSFLGAMGDGWSGDLSNDGIAQLDDAGDYISAHGWAQLIGNAVYSSDMQTAKISDLNAAISSQDGKKLFEDFSANVDLLIPLLKRVGLTQNDVVSLVQKLLQNLIRESENTANSIISRINAVRQNSKLSAKARENLSETLVDISAVKTAISMTSQQRQELENAVFAASDTINEIIAFAYNMSMEAISDSLRDVLLSGGGALGDITQQELNTVVDALISNVTALKATLTDSGLEKVNKALSMLINRFDIQSMPSAVYAEVIKYAKYVYSFVDVAPILCDVVESAGDVLKDKSAIIALDDVITNGLSNGAAIYNTAIMLSRVAQTVLDKQTISAASDMVDKMLDKASSGDWQKSMPILAIDLVMNLTFLSDSQGLDGNLQLKHPDVITNDNLNRMVAAMYFNKNYMAFKQAYLSYKNGEIAMANLSSAANSCRFSDLGIENIYLVTDTDNWYRFYVTEGLTQATRNLRELCSVAAADLKLFVGDYLSPNSTQRAAIDYLAGLVTVPSETDLESYYGETLKTVNDNISVGGLLGVLALLAFMI